MNFKKIFRIFTSLFLLLSLTLALAGCGAEGKADSPAGPSAAAAGAKSTGGMLTLRMLDIGQGDSFLLEKDGQFVLIDSGDIEHRAALTKLLRQYGVREISKVIITHPHEDHLGGMAAVFKNFSVGAVYDNGVSTNTGSYRNYLKTIQSKKIPYHTLKAGESLELFPGVSFDVLGPVSLIRDSKGKPDQNNNSIVGRMSYGSFSVMFSGDAEKEEESAVLKKGGTFASTVLKSGHHGSRTSSSAAWLRAVSPKAALISCGLDNSYGHPHKTVLDRYAKANIQVYRTDRNGTVTVTSDGSSYKVEKEH